jgi:hypothetical protein
LEICRKRLTLRLTPSMVTMQQLTSHCVMLQQRQVPFLCSLVVFANKQIHTRYLKRTLQFTEAPPTGTNNIQVLFLGIGTTTTVPADGTVTGLLRLLLRQLR